MEIRRFVTDQFNESARLLQQLGQTQNEQIARIGELLASCLLAGHKVLIFGNGGSAADAQHFAAELIGCYRRERSALPAIALTTDTSLITAVGNDYGFDRVFSRQVEALAEEGDIAIGITTSGKSPNVISGLKAARAVGASTVAFTGPNTAELEIYADEIIAINTTDTPRGQEAHAVIIHILCDIIEHKMDNSQDGPAD